MFKSEPVIKEETEKVNTKSIGKYKHVKEIGRRVREESKEKKHFPI
jgi:hypothetical protein